MAAGTSGRRGRAPGPSAASSAPPPDTGEPPRRAQPEERNARPPEPALVCPHFCRPYTANGERCTTLVEIATPARTPSSGRAAGGGLATAPPRRAGDRAPGGAAGRHHAPWDQRLDVHALQTLRLLPAAASGRGLAGRYGAGGLAGGRWPTASGASCRWSSRWPRRFSRTGKRRRCAILQALAGSPGCTANHPTLCTALGAAAIVLDDDRLREHLYWLEEPGALDAGEHPPFTMASVTPYGPSLAEGRACGPGRYMSLGHTGDDRGRN